MVEHETREGVGHVGSVHTVEGARALHHLATADPEPERDGQMTGPAHEAKYGLERAEFSAVLWELAGVHPMENRALVEGDEGYDDGTVRVSSDVSVRPGVGVVETAAAPAAAENTSVERPKV